MTYRQIRGAQRHEPHDQESVDRAVEVLSAEFGESYAPVQRIRNALSDPQNVLNPGANGQRLWLMWLPPICAAKASAAPYSSTSSTPSPTRRAFRRSPTTAQQSARHSTSHMDFIRYSLPATVASCTWQVRQRIQPSFRHFFRRLSDHSRPSRVAARLRSLSS
jgi:hypothetical protein